MGPAGPWGRPLVGDAATRVLHDLAAMVTDQRTGSIDLGDLYPSRGFVLDVDEFIHSLGLRPGRGDDGELLPILCQFMTWRVAGFLGNRTDTYLMPVGIPLAPGRIVREHSPELFQVNSAHVRSLDAHVRSLVAHLRSLSTLCEPDRG